MLVLCIFRLLYFCSFSIAFVSMFVCLHFVHLSTACLHVVYSLFCIVLSYYNYFLIIISKPGLVFKYLNLCIIFKINLYF